MEEEEDIDVILDEEDWPRVDNLKLDGGFVIIGSLLCICLKHSIIKKMKARCHAHTCNPSCL
jgi:hypothetical protein